MPGGIKRKATLSADLNLQAQVGSAGRTPWVPTVSTEGNEDNDDKNEENEEEEGDDTDTEEEDPSYQADSQPQPGPSLVSQRNPRSHSRHRSCPRSERKKIRHLPHHHKLLNQSVN